MRQVSAMGLGLVLAFGCSGPRVAEVVSEATGETQVVSWDDPVLRMENGEQIRVEGIPPGQTMEFQEKRATRADGRVVTFYDFPDEAYGRSSAERPEKPQATGKSLQQSDDL
ncbi:hypothetical protein [Planctomyces sp. SH-PL14]|uniref:hypothetical protein n=1 Tax=Planctomyces sp. SH-PL14 TaxID=1632864 RepID=UPI00078D51C7|nr:hypothetical protein [Planctomyces sp. SH-PL14]AMV16282.1 hypothetical protein VT03_00225 [Planctomyces sp. SH-PL14]